jgi:hypothetical protein
MSHSSLYNIKIETTDTALKYFTQLLLDCRSLKLIVIKIIIFCFFFKKFSCASRYTFSMVSYLSLTLPLFLPYSYSYLILILTLSLSLPYPYPYLILILTLFVNLQIFLILTLLYPTYLPYLLSSN